MKKIFLRAVVLLLVLSLAIVAFASCEETGKQDSDAQSEKEEVNDSEKTSDDNEIGTEGLAYKLLDNDTYEVSVGTAKETTEIVIPSKYNEKPVTSIGDRAFYSCNGLTSIDIADSVKSIGERAFSDCTKLASVTIGNGVESIGSSAFLGTAYYKNASNWENGVLYIGKYLIEANDDISGDYSVKEGTKIIASSAFCSCHGLTSIDIPDSVKSIGDDAFAWCDGFTSIDIPDSVKSIGERAFSDCTKLASVTIGNGVESIGSSAFYGTAYYNNESNWENGVLYIGKYFIDAKNKSGNYSVKEGTKIIASSAFCSCSGLTSIDIPDSVKSIGSSAFYNCYGLTSVTIGNGVESIGDYAFSDCTGLTSISVDENNTAYKDTDGNLYSKDGKTLVQYAIGKTDASFAIPDGVESIGFYAFYHCTGLTSIDIPDNVKTIGYSAFSRCTGLTSIDIPDSVTSIGYSAFEDCDGLTSVTIGNGVESIGDYAFKNCTGLTSVTIGNGVESIGYGAFHGCTGLTSIDIPDSVTSIGSGAFYECTGLMSIKFRGSEAEWNAIKKDMYWNVNVPSSCQIIFNYTGE